MGGAASSHPLFMEGEVAQVENKDRFLSSGQWSGCLEGVLEGDLEGKGLECRDKEV